MDTNMFDDVPPNLNPSKPFLCLSYFILFIKRVPIMIDITSSITYNTSAPLINNGTVDEYHDVNDTALVPIVVVPQPVASRSYLLSFGFDTMTDGTNRAVINQVTFNYPITPAVFSELSLGSNATIQEAYGPTSIVLDHLEVFDIVIQNTDTGKHPL